MEALDVPEDKHSNKDKQMSIGRKKFNMDPKKGECNVKKIQITERLDIKVIKRARTILFLQTYSKDKVWDFRLNFVATG